MFGQFISVEMVVLWAFESFLSAFMIYAFIALPADGRAVSAAVQYEYAHQAAVFAFTIGLTAIALGLYRPDTCLEVRRTVISSVASGVIAFPMLLLVGQGLGINPDMLVGPDPLWPCKILVAWLVCLVATRVAFTQAMRHGFLVRRMIVVGSDERISAIRDSIRGPKRGFFRITEATSQSAAQIGLDADGMKRRRIWGIVMSATARPAMPEGVLARCAAHGIRIVDDVEFRERNLGRIDLERLEPGWLAGARAMHASRLECRFRRAGDILIATLFLFGTAPLMALAALLIRLDSPGAVLYRQERVGLHGRRFTLLKFRSMRIDAESGSGPSWAAKADPRITRIGKFMRRTRIDELPQVFNVLSGEMAFIGPRPERPHFVSRLAEAIPFYNDRAEVKPGLTGWAQVNFPYGASIEDARMKLAYDLYYIRHRTLLLDMLILLSTIRVILFQEGAR